MSIENSDVLRRLGKLPFDQREKLFNAVSEILEKADKPSATTDRIEKSLTRFLAKQWKGWANKAVPLALAILKGNMDAKVTKKDGQQIIDKLEDGLKGYPDSVSDRVTKDIKSFYKKNKSIFADRFDVKGKGKKSELTFDGQSISSAGKNFDKSRLENLAAFGSVDVNTVNSLTNLTMISIGDHFALNLKPAVTKAIMEGVVERGLNKKNAAEYLRQELTKIVGSVNQAVPASIAQMGEERVNDYFKGLVTTNMNFARNFGQVTAMEEAEIARYMIVAIIDDRTTMICLQLNGQTFEMRYAVEHRDRVAEMESVDELKDFAPWHRDISEVGLSADRNKEAPSAQEVLAKAGMALPPFHFRCRSEVHPV